MLPLAQRPLRILLADNLMIRRYGNLRMGPGRKLMCGAIRNNWRLCEFSDRDMARLLAPLGIRAIGGRIANAKFLLTAKNFKPDAILLGHCDYLRNETLARIRDVLPNVRIAHFNVDPLWQASTCAQMRERAASCDALFATTAGPVLKTWCNAHTAVAYMPNPSDPSMEHEDNGCKQAFARDLFFAGNSRAGDPRWVLLSNVLTHLPPDVRCEIFGADAAFAQKIPARPVLAFSPSIWGARYEEVLSSSKMSLSLNRREGDKWYASDRIAHLMGYGILTFQSARNEMQHFFSDAQTVWFDTAEELAEKISYYHAHDAERAAIATAGRMAYHRLFNGARVLKYMLEVLWNEPFSEPYEWAAEVYR